MYWRLEALVLAVAIVAQHLLISGAAPAQAQIAGGGSAGTSGGTSGQSGQSGQTGTAGNTSGGIFVDAQGVVRPMFQQDKSGRLDKKRRHELAGRSLPGDLNEYSPLRKVSLVQLETACESYARDKQHVSSEMQFLAGLQRIDYVFVYPAEHDIVIA